MTTPQPAHGVPGPVIPRAAIPGPATAPDRETLGRVLDGLRDLDAADRAHPEPTAGGPDPADGAPAVPLPRRRTSPRR